MIGLTINPSYLVRDESVLVQPTMQAGVNNLIPQPLNSPQSYSTLHLIPKHSKH